MAADPDQTQSDAPPLLDVTCAGTSAECREEPPGTEVLSPGEVEGGATAAFTGASSGPAEPDILTIEVTSADGGERRSVSPHDVTAALLPDATCAFTTDAAPRAGSPDGTVATGVDGSPGSSDRTRADAGNHTHAPDGPARAAPSRTGAPRRFLLEKFHARGGMGEVWLAEDVDIGRKVALKKMRREVRDQRDSFLWEAQITGQLEHPGIVPVHELSIDEHGEPYYVMKFVHGQTLLKAIDDYHKKTDAQGEAREVKRLRLLQVFLDLCQTMAYAHSRGVIHRDIKPENVMVGEYGETLVLDWGLAKVVGREDVGAPQTLVRRSFSGDTMESQAGSIKGTPFYMAPEVARGAVEEVDHQSDVYLLGATLYHILTGKRPRQGKKLAEIVEAAQKPPVPPRRLDPTVARPLEAICMKSMAVAKTERYASAAALAEDMQRFLAGEPVTAYRESWLERGLRWCRKHRQALSRAASVLVLVALVGIGAWQLHAMEQRHAEELKEQEAQRLEAQRVADELSKQKQARLDLDKFRALAEEVRFLAASTDPVAANAPFFDPEAGQARGKEALALAKPWADHIEQFPLPEERAGLRQEIYDLMLLLAQVQLNGGSGQDKVAGTATEVSQLLDHADRLNGPSRGYHRLRAKVFTVLGDAPQAAVEEKRAADAKTPATALDYFLAGETYRAAAAKPVETPDGSWLRNRETLQHAVEQYQLALRVDPDHFWSHFQLGRCYLSLGRGAEATQTLSTCIALRPKSPWGYSARGLSLAVQKRYNEAEADLNRAVELDPDALPARLNRGVLAWLRKDDDAALADFDAVLAAPPAKRLVEAAFFKAQLFAGRGEMGAARKSVDAALEGKAPIAAAYLLRAQLALTEGDDPQALADLQSYFAAGKPNYDRNGPAERAQRAHRLRLMALDVPVKFRLGRLKLALSELREAVKAGERTPEVYDDLGAVLENLGKTRDAVEAYREAIELRPRDVKLLVKRGWAYEKLQPPDLEKAQADFETATEIDPENAEAHTGLGYMQACRKLEKEALREANRAVLRGAGDYLILHNVACIYAKLSEQERTAEFEDLALDQIQRAVDLWKRDRAGPNEIALVEAEPAFTRSMRARPEFRKLIAEDGK